MTAEALPCTSSRTQTKRASLHIVFAVSFLWSTSSLMVFAVLPAFLTEELGVKYSTLGLIEGVALSLAFFAKVYSGVLSDALGSRKSLLFIGSVLTTLSKPFFALASSAYHIFWIRSLDRFGKGIRSSPTDALVADLSDRENYGAAYGLRQAYYTSGAIFGSLLAMWLLESQQDAYRLLFNLAVIPSLLALLLIWYGLRRSYNERSHAHNEKANEAVPMRIIVRQARLLPRSFWYLMGVVSCLMLARFSEAFLTLRARQLGLAVAQLPLLTIVMDIVHASIAFPFGKWADRYCRKKILLAGLWVQCLAAALLFFSDSIASVFFAIILVGCYMGITQGVLRALVADASPNHLRGTAFAVFYLCSGTAVLLGNSFCGVVSEMWGLSSVFAGGAIFTALSIALFLPSIVSSDHAAKSTVLDNEG
jgi:MFS family permease